MKNLLSFILPIITFISCNTQATKSSERTEKREFMELLRDDFELLKPKDESYVVVVLFGGYPEKAKDIKREFNIAETAREKGIAILYMNYNQRLWLEEREKQLLAQQLSGIFSELSLPSDKIYFGGFSSGGNVALLISDYLVKHTYDIQPKGVFVVDAPIDLAALYRSAEKNVARNFSEPSVQESKWIVQKLGERFGTPDKNIQAYAQYGIYTSQIKSFKNIVNLHNVPLRFYSEPDTSWWKKHRKADFDQLNAFYLEELSKQLKKAGFKHVEYVATENKGYRANGDRHPHSWSIVDIDKLMDWITK